MIDDVVADLEHVRQRKLEATQRLLGDTIAIDEDDWQQLTKLPGWTRAHVATHLAINADTMRGTVEGVLAAAPAPMYTAGAESDALVEQGSAQSALALQIELDRSAGQLNDAFNQLSPQQWDYRIGLRGGVVPIRYLVLARLAEVVMHHVDLDVGFGLDELDAELARWLLEWTVYRHVPGPDEPAMHITTTSGFEAEVSDPGGRAAILVHGDDAQVAGWLAGRLPPDAVAGAAQLGPLPIV